MKAKKDKFLLLSLKEEKAKKLASVINSKACRKILDHLADKDGITASKISEDLNIPLNTVTYNLQQLLNSGLVVSEEFHYSKKGREVDHYKLANKYIIIAPSETPSWKEKLGNILPITGIFAAAAIGVQMFYGYLISGQSYAAPVMEKMAGYAEKGAAPVMAEAEEAIVKGAVDSTAEEVGARASEIAAESAPKAVDITQTILPEPSPWLNITLWFVLGMLFALAVYFIIKKIKKR